MKKTGFLLIVLWVFSTASGFAQDADEWMEKGRSHFNNGDYANAITAFSEVINQGGENYSTALYLRGVAYLNFGNFDAGISDLTRILKLMDYPYAYINRGIAYGVKELYHKTVQDFRKSIEHGLDVNNFSVDKDNKTRMWFCGTLYMEIVVSRFLNNNASVTKYENLLKTVCEKNGVTKAEVENFYRTNIRSLVSEIVNEEFNTVHFYMDRTYETILSCNPKNGNYNLTYFVPPRTLYNVIEQPGLENMDVLLDFMSVQRLNQSCIDTVKNYAGRIPAVEYARLKAQGSADALELITEALTNFFTNTSQNNFNVLVGIKARYFLSGSRDEGSHAHLADAAFSAAIRKIEGSFDIAQRNAPLSAGVYQIAGTRDIAERVYAPLSEGYGRNAPTLARYPNDPRYRVFEGR